MRTVLFDLDDTLYPEISFVRSGFRAVAQHLADAVSLDEEELFERMMSVLKRDGRGRVFDTVLRELGRRCSELVPVLVQVYRTHRPHIRLFEDVEPGLRRLRETGTRMGIVTDGLASVQRNKIEALRLESLVDTVVCTDEMGPGQGKPSVRPFETALEALDSEPTEAAYVGDDPSKDFQGPRKLGMVTIHMRRKGLTPRLADGRHGEADLKVETFQELVAKVGN